MIVQSSFGETAEFGLEADPDVGAAGVSSFISTSAVSDCALLLIVSVFVAGVIV